MKKANFVKGILMAVMISLGTMVRPVFADIYDYEWNPYDPATSAFQIKLEAALKCGGLSEKEAELVWNTKKLFMVSQEERKQICIETCKWALAKNLDLAKDPTIPLEVHRRFGFIKSANRIKNTPGLKKAFNYDDVDFSLYHENSFQMERIRQGRFPYTCAAWVHDCYFYGYLKVKEKEIRKAAELWGYSFKEFTLRLSRTTGDWIITAGAHKTKPIPPGADIGFRKDPGHTQLSLGKFGFSSNGNFCPDVSRKTRVHGRKQPWSWGLPIFKNPIVTAALTSWSSIKSEIYSRRTSKKSRKIKGLFHLPCNRWTSQTKPWFGIKVIEKKVKKVKRRFLVSKVYNGSPAERLGIRKGDRLWILNGRAIFNLKDLQESIEGIASGPTGYNTVLRSKENGESFIEIEISTWATVEMKEKKDIPPGSY